MKNFWKEYRELVIGAVLIAILIIIMASCSSTKNVPVVHDTIYRNNTQYVDRLTHDSIYMHDSVWVTLKGDTVWMDRWHTKYVEKIAHDSIRCTDTIYQSVDRPVEVVKTKTPVKAYLIIGFLVLAVFGLMAALVSVMDKKKA